jgi:regulator of sigma E protease
MTYLIMAGQLILGLTILVGLHELGHMLTAKWFGMRVERFSIGFPPRLFGKKIGETDYQIGALPLGGYVKISGMIDESLDTAQMQGEPEPWEFRAKPAWQRLIVMLGGIIVNVITGIVIFSLIVWSYGESYLPASEARFGVVTNELGREIGFRDGDKVLAVNGKTLVNFDDIYSPDALLAHNAVFTVERDGQRVELPVPANILDKLSQRKEEAALFVAPAYPFSVERVLAGRPAAKAGIEPGDRITSVAGEPTPLFHTFQSVLKAHAGQTVPLTVDRKGQTVNLTAAIEKEGTLGFERKPLLSFSTRQYGLLEAVPVGTEKAFGVITANLKAFAKIFRGEASASNSLSGPIGIARDAFGGSFDALHFWQIVGMLSMVLAFMNILPIPALDGGHATFLLYEMIARRKPSEAFLENAQKVGMVLLLGLMVFAFGNDFYKMLF